MKKLRLLFFALFLVLSASAQERPLWLRFCALSPDGQTVAFSYHGDIYTVSAQGGNARQITSHPAYDSYPV